MQRKWILSAIFALLLTFAAATAMAQLPAMGPPIPTVIVVTKPAPDQTFANKQVVTFGIGPQAYKFILKDAYTNHRKIRWLDIWEYVSLHQPNFVVQGPDTQKLVEIQPGQSMTVTGMFAPLDRTFEVVSVEPSGEGGPQHY
jgi:hypothetical protein